MLLVEQNAHVALGVAHYGYIMENGRIVDQRPDRAAARTTPTCSASTSAAATRATATRASATSSITSAASAGCPDANASRDERVDRRAEGPAAAAAAAALGDGAARRGRPAPEGIRRLAAGHLGRVRTRSRAGSASACCGSACSRAQRRGAGRELPRVGVRQLGAALVGGVTAGVYPTRPAPEVEYLLAPVRGADHRLRGPGAARQGAGDARPPAAAARDRRDRSARPAPLRRAPTCTTSPTSTRWAAAPKRRTRRPPPRRARARSSTTSA